jgi:Uma2 family endonuclease
MWTDAVATTLDDPLPRMTLSEWANLAEDEPGELVDEQLVEEEVTSFLHEAVVSWLLRTLGTWAALRGGWVFGSEAKYAVAPGRGRKCDVSMYLPGSPLPGRVDRLSHKPPSVMIEVISPQPRDARRDRVEKLREYAKFGAPFYWMVEPDLRVIEILQLGGKKRYTIALSASEGRHAVPGCEGLTLDLDALWDEVDRMPIAPEVEEDERTTQRLRRKVVRPRKPRKPRPKR